MVAKSVVTQRNFDLKRCACTWVAGIESVGVSRGRRKYRSHGHVRKATHIDIATTIANTSQRVHGHVPTVFTTRLCVLKCAATERFSRSEGRWLGKSIGSGTIFGHTLKYNIVLCGRRVVHRLLRSPVGRRYKKKSYFKTTCKQNGFHCVSSLFSYSQIKVCTLSNK